MAEGETYRDAVVSDTEVESEEGPVDTSEFDLVRDVLLVRAIVEFVTGDPEIMQRYVRDGVRDFAPREMYAWIVNNDLFQLFMDSYIMT